MPTNKNAQLRYHILDDCFSDKNHRYTIEDLVEVVNDALYDYYGRAESTVTLRQIREDMHFTRDSKGYNAPIKAYRFDGKKCYYRYSEPYSIFNEELSKEDAKQLNKVAPIEHVVLRFTENRFPYVLSKKLHPSQKQGDEPNTITIDVKPTRELTQQIFSFGPDVEVLAPESLRQFIKEKVEETYKKYSAVKKDCTK